MEEVYKAVELARAKGLPKENYWLYFKKNSTAVEAYEVENKRPGWLGFFVEDDSRIPGIVGVAKKKATWRKHNEKGN
jgi:hypothetical protein